MPDENWISVMEFIKAAEEEGLKITYSMLRRYIQKGIFPNPRKFPMRGNVGYYEKNTALNQLRNIRHLEASGYYTLEQISDALAPLGGQTASLRIEGTAAVPRIVDKQKITLAGRLAKKIKQMKNQINKEDERYWNEVVENLRAILHRAEVAKWRDQKGIVGDCCHLFIREKAVDILIQESGKDEYCKITVAYFDGTKKDESIAKKAIPNYINTFKRIYGQQWKNRYFKVDLRSLLGGVIGV